jgi:hypothetical protein
MDTESEQSNDLMSGSPHNSRGQCHQRYNLPEVSPKKYDFYNTGFRYTCYSLQYQWKQSCERTCTCTRSGWFTWRIGPQSLRRSCLYRGGITTFTRSAWNSLVYYGWLLQPSYSLAKGIGEKIAKALILRGPFSWDRECDVFSKLQRQWMHPT